METRICDRCGRTMTEGFVVGEGAIELCDECFEPWMDEACPDGWRENEHADDPCWDGGFYDEKINGEWEDTGIYWTEW